MKHPPTASVK